MKYFIFAIFLFGCSTATARAPVTDSNGFVHSWSVERCQVLLDLRDASTWGAAFAGGLAGVGGLATAFPDDSKKDTRLALGITSAVIAAAATSLTVLAKMKSNEFEAYCNQGIDIITKPVAEPVVEKPESPIPLITDVYPGDAGIE